MSALLPFVEEWLCRSALAGGVILLFGALLTWGVRQPARRQRIGELAVAASIFVATLCALPAWLPVSLGLWPAPAQAEAAAMNVAEGDALAAAPVHPPASEWEDVDLDEADLVLLGAMINLDQEREDADPRAIGVGVDPAPASHASQVAASSSWVKFLPWVWRAYALVLAVLVGRFVLGYVGLARLWRASEVPPRRALALLEELTPHWRTRPQLRVCRRLVAPVSFGVWRPTILVPPTFCRLGAEAGLRSVLVHELTHLERRDALSCILLALAQPLYFYQPWYWWLRRQVRLCQEYVADAAAAALTSSEDYAEYLMSLSTLGAQRAPAGTGVVGVLGSSSDLLRRITMLLNDGQSLERRCPAWWTLGAATGFMALAILLSGVGLRAQAAPPTDEEVKKAKQEVEVTVTLAGKDGAVNVKPAKVEVIEVVLAPETGDKDHVVILKDGKPEIRRLLLTSPGVDKDKIKSWVVTQATDGKAGEARVAEKIVVIEDANLVKGAPVIRALPQGGQPLVEKLGRISLAEVREAAPGKPLLLKAKAVDGQDDVLWVVAQADDKEAAKEKGHEAAQAKYKAALKLVEGDEAKALQEAIKRAQELAGKAGEQGWEEARKQLEEAVKQLEKARRDFDARMKEARAQAEKARASAAGKLAEAAKHSKGLAFSTITGTRLGVMLGSVSEEARSQLELPDDQGLAIVNVVPDSPAAKAGFQKHDILLDFNGKAVTSNLAEFIKAVQAAPADEKLNAVVLRKGKKTAIKGIVLPEAAKGGFSFEVDDALRESLKGPMKLELDAKLQEQLKGLKEFQVKPVLPAVPATPERFKIMTPKGQNVVTTITRTDDRFTTRYQEGTLVITITGSVKGDAAKVSEIVVNDNGVEKKFANVDEAPEQYRDKVKNLLDAVTKAQVHVEVRTKDKD